MAKKAKSASVALSKKSATASKAKVAKPATKSPAKALSKAAKPAKSGAATKATAKPAGKPSVKSDSKAKPGKQEAVKAAGVKVGAKGSPVPGAPKLVATTAASEVAKSSGASKANGAPKAKAPALKVVEASPKPTPASSTVEAAAEEPADKVTEKKKKKDDFKFDRSGDLEEQWRAIFEKSKSLKPVPYKMSDNYEARTALTHKVLGWGFVLTSQNNRLEVLFKDGLKILISNYKG